jgi:hypothetical protein
MAITFTDADGSCADFGGFTAIAPADFWDAAEVQVDLV